jgi:hypothetical protein
MPAPVALPTALVEEAGGGFYYSDFWDYGGGDPLIQGHSVFFREALRGLLDRNGKSEG